MIATSSQNKPRQHFRFSLGMLLVLITCICCAFAGRIYGIREGEAAKHNTYPTWTKVYFVGDLTKLDARNDGDAAMKKIKRQCAPGVWQEEGGKSQMSFLPVNSTIIVSTNYVVHRQISTLLQEMRQEEFPPSYVIEEIILPEAGRGVADGN